MRRVPLLHTLPAHAPADYLPLLHPLPAHAHTPADSTPQYGVAPSLLTSHVAPCPSLSSLRLLFDQQIVVHAVRRAVDVLGTASWADPQSVLFTTLRWDGGARAATISSHQLVLHAAGVRGLV